LTDRLPAKLEATALIRQVENGGGNGAIVKRGDPDRGALVLLVTERGVPKALIERRMSADFTYRWAVEASDGPITTEKFRILSTERARFDPDCWLIELDIPDAERFIAETTASA
jgi:hypothetical protein